MFYPGTPVSPTNNTDRHDITQLKCNYICIINGILFDLLCVTPLSAIFQLYHGDQFLVVEEAGENHRPWTSN
jgi:hypothetical protein